MVLNDSWPAYINDISYSIPYLQFDDLPTHLYFFCGKLHTHGRVTIAGKLVTIITRENGCLTH